MDDDSNFGDDEAVSGGDLDLGGLNLSDGSDDEDDMWDMKGKGK